MRHLLGYLLLFGTIGVAVWAAVRLYWPKRRRGSMRIHLGDDDKKNG